MAAATRNFPVQSLIGQGGFGRVYKGQLEGSNQVVAVKQLDRNGSQGNTEFLVEVLMLSLLDHPNLVNLVGYCADGDQRLLVYESMELDSVEDHLFEPTTDQTLDWKTRMKIAVGAAKRLEYLHDKANPPVIYRDLKSADILLSKGKAIVQRQEEILTNRRSCASRPIYNERSIPSSRHCIDVCAGLTDYEAHDC